MLVKTTLKSHFKFKKTFKRSKKRNILVKNMVIFLLLSKFFFKGVKVSLFFNKICKHSTNILKAPSRHKKFFHQVFFEFFLIKIFFHLPLFNTIVFINAFGLFRSINALFLKLGSNILFRDKVSLSIPFRELAFSRNHNDLF